MYHSISEDGRFFSVIPKNFERQLKFLFDKNFNVISSNNLCDILINKNNLNSKTVVITFDDGYKDNYSIVFPLLKKYKLKVTIFLIVNLIGEEGYLNWEEIIEMKNSGLVEFGCHTLSHPNLTQLSRELLIEELNKSKKSIEEKLGGVCQYFAYPKGYFNDLVIEKIKEAGFQMAFATKKDAINLRSDIFKLPRLSVDSATTWWQFLGKIS